MVSADDFSFQCLQLWILKLLTGADDSHPNRDTVGEKLTSASSTGAFDVWSASVVFQARTWTGEILPAAVGTLTGVSEE